MKNTTFIQYGRLKIKRESVVLFLCCNWFMCLPDVLHVNVNVILRLLAKFYSRHFPRIHLLLDWTCLPPPG